MAYEGKRSSGKRKGLGILILVILLIALLIAGALWFWFGRDAVPEKVKNDDVQTEVQDDVIRTPYGALSYPGMWTDRVTHTVEQDGSDYRVSFQGEADGAPVPLFTLCYGTVLEQGYVMGQMTDGTQVSVVMHAIEPQEGWSEETLNGLYALQESVNDLLVQLRENPEFIQAQ